MMSPDLAEVIDFGLAAAAILCLIPSMVSSWRRTRGKDAPATPVKKRR